MVNYLDSSSSENFTILLTKGFSLSLSKAFLFIIIELLLIRTRSNK
jgi:hypothetical protein